MSKMPPEHVMDEAEAFDGAEAAVARLMAIYAKGRDLLGEHFERFAGGAENMDKADARYPAVWIDVAPGRDQARLDHVLDHDLPLEVPIPAIAEVQLALTAAVSKVTQQDGQELKQHLRTGTVVSTDDRDWELRYDELSTFFNQSRAIAVDMESATISANGFRLRVPYGTLLCVSDKPLHGEIKLPGMANAFYAERVSQHLRICLEAVDIMREGVGHQALHSRKLRSFDEPPFR